MYSVHGQHRLLLLRLIHNVAGLFQCPLVDRRRKGFADPLLDVLKREIISIGSSSIHQLIKGSIDSVMDDSLESCGAVVWRTVWPRDAGTDSPRTAGHLLGRTARDAPVPGPEIEGVVGVTVCLSIPTQE